MLNKSNDTIIRNFQILMEKYDISVHTPLFLISAIKDDLEINFKNYSQLITYSFKVAGTVGLMMCKIMDKFTKIIFKRYPIRNCHANNKY